MSAAAGGAKKEKSTGSSFVELIVIVVVALGLALAIQAFLIKPYRIPSESMVPTLKVGQRVLVNRIGNRFSDPHVGEILVFHPPAPADSEHTGVQGRGPSGQCSGVWSATRVQPFTYGPSWWMPYR